MASVAKTSYWLALAPIETGRLHTFRYLAEAKALIELGAAGRTTDSEQLMQADTTVHRFIYRCGRNVYSGRRRNAPLNLSLRIWYLVLDGCREKACSRTAISYRRWIAGEAARARDRGRPRRDGPANDPLWAVT